MSAIDLTIPYTPLNLSSATILVTGGSSGIGLALVERFLKAGSTVIITGRRQTQLDEAKKKFPQLNTIVNDVGNEKDRERLAKEVLNNYPKLNILVNNAGIQRRGNPLTDTSSWAEISSEIDINFSGPIHLCSLFIPHFQKQKESAIMNVTSGLAFIPPAFAPVYGATKAALHSYTMSVRFLLKDTTVQVIEIVPPAVKTNLGGSHNFGEDLDVFSDSVFARLIKGEKEIGFAMSEDGRNASRPQINETFVKLNSFLLGPNSPISH
jgi:uncharacterized oxidoreductase